MDTPTSHQTLLIPYSEPASESTKNDAPSTSGHNSDNRNHDMHVIARSTMLRDRVLTDSNRPPARRSMTPLERNTGWAGVLFSRVANHEPTGDPLMWGPVCSDLFLLNTKIAKTAKEGPPPQRSMASVPITRVNRSRRRYRPPESGKSVDENGDESG